MSGFSVRLFPWGMCRVFFKGRAPGKLTSCEQDLAMTLPGCFLLLYLLPFIRKTKNAWLKNLTDLLHKNLMKPLDEGHVEIPTCVEVSKTVNKELKGFFLTLIFPHIFNVNVWILLHYFQFCGDVIAGVSLLSPSVMRFKHEKFCNIKVDALLRPRSVYIIR